MQLSAEAQAGLLRVKAAMAANAHLSSEELLRHRTAALSDRQPRLPLRRPPKPRAPRPRDREPEPKLSRQFQPATSTLATRDRRLTYSARVLAGWIVALAGRRGFIETTRARLGAAIGLRPRTITRALADLIRLGYLTCEFTRTRTGAYAGLRLVVRPRLMPFYVIEGKDWPGGASHVRDPKKQGFQDDHNRPQDAHSDPPDREKG